MFINKIYSCLDCKKGHFFLNAAACKAQSTGKLNFSHKACKHHIQRKKKGLQDLAGRVQSYVWPAKSQNNLNCRCYTSIGT